MNLPFLPYFASFEQWEMFIQVPGKAGVGNMANKLSPYMTKWNHAITCFGYMYTLSIWLLWFGIFWCWSFSIRDSIGQPYWIQLNGIPNQNITDFQFLKLHMTLGQGLHLGNPYTPWTTTTHVNLWRNKRFLIYLERTILLTQ